jgi:Putative transmembrane protein (Alph_Pro_TM)
VFELHDGFAADAQRSTLVVSKVGLEADIYDFAQQRAFLYGLTAIALAIVSGWLAGVIFRRG